MERAAGCRISWLIAESFGRVGNRYHCHLLLANVEHLSISEWREKANAELGRTEIEPFDITMGGAHYVAKNGLTQQGDLHFGGGGFDTQPHNRGEVAEESGKPQQRALPVAEEPVRTERRKRRPVVEVHVCALGREADFPYWGWVEIGSGKCHMGIDRRRRPHEAELVALLNFLRSVKEHAVVNVHSDNKWFDGLFTGWFNCDRRQTKSPQANLSEAVRRHDVKLKVMLVKREQNAARTWLERVVQEFE
jgi:hypothetical protein